MKDSKVSRGNLLRAARNERSWKQQELADAIGTSCVNVSRWENGRTTPSPYFRQRLSEVFKKTPAELGLLSPSPAPAPSPTPTHKRKLWLMPNSPNPFFTGRERLLEQILERLSARREASLTQPQALYGLGGIGKTQTATEFVFRHVDTYSHVFWLQANDRETLVADFVTLAQLIELPEPAKDEQYETRIIDAVKRWLSENTNWLLVLDNADDLPMVQKFLPTRRKGYILFTTRAEAAGRIAESIEVEKLTLEEGTLLLLRASKRLKAKAPLEQAKAEDRALAEEIAREMDGLPLALVQAAAFIDETGCSLAEYVNLYATHRQELLARGSNLLLDYDETVATTWSLSFQQIEQQSPAAAVVLRVCAFLVADAIPKELLARGIAELSAIPGAEGLDALELEEALALLRRYSLLRRNSDNNMLNMHRLVQAVLKESLDEHTRRQWAERTVRVVSAAFPETDYGNAATQQVYIPHAQECATLIEQYHLYFSEAAQLIFKAGVSQYLRGFYSQSTSYHQQALLIREEIFGSNHPDVADSLNELALLARNQGNYKKAEEFHKKALAIREKALGELHPLTAKSLNNLSVLYRRQGNYDLAEPLLRRALNINEKLHGSEHPDTLIFSINLASLYAKQHKFEQAKQLLKETLVISEQNLASDHPIIAQNLSLLANLYLEQREYEQAENHWKRAVVILEKIWGKEHPSLTECLQGLAELYYAQGRYLEAEIFCQRAFNISEKAFGSKHADTIANRNHLTAIRSKIETKQGDEPAPPLS